jgi:hypothetical protein
MCAYDLIYHVPCGHTERRLKKYCHFARNDPGHQCFGAWTIKDRWEQPRYECENCTKHRQYAEASGLGGGVQQFYGGSGGR